MDDAPWWLEGLADRHWGSAAAWGQSRLAEVHTDVDDSRTLQVFLTLKHQAATTRLQLTHGPQLKMDPAIVYAPSTDSFVVLFVVERAPGSHDIHALTVATDAGGNPTVSGERIVELRPLDAAAEEPPSPSLQSPRAVWVSSRQAAFVVFNTDTTVHGAWIKPNRHAPPEATAAFALVNDRSGRVSSPVVAYAEAADRLMVAWGVMRSQENIEFGVMGPGDEKLTMPDRTAWTHKQSECNLEMAPGCLEGGDRPALAYNPTLHKFGLAIADDLNDGSRLEGFLIDETCSSTVCGVDKVGRDDDANIPADRRERALATIDRIAAVAIAPADLGFVVGFAFGVGAPAAPDKLGVLAFDAAGTAASTPTLIVNGAGSRVALGSAGAVAGDGTRRGEALLLFRQRSAVDATGAVGNHTVAVDPRGAVMGAR